MINLPSLGIPNLQPGDILACWGKDWVARQISLMTSSLISPPYLRYGPSHVAIIVEENGSPLWVESTTLCGRTCSVTGRERPRGSQAHEPVDRLEDYVGNGRVDLYRLLPIYCLNDSESTLLTRILIDYFVIPQVDYDMGSALVSGTRVVKLLRILRSNLDTVFCSELIAAVLMRLNRMNNDNPSRYNPACLLRELVRTGVYRREGEIGYSYGTYFLKTSTEESDEHIR